MKSSRFSLTRTAALSSRDAAVVLDVPRSVMYRARQRRTLLGKVGSHLSHQLENDPTTAMFQLSVHNKRKALVPVGWFVEASAEPQRACAAPASRKRSDWNSPLN